VTGCDISSSNLIALSQQCLSWSRIRGLCVWEALDVSGRGTAPAKPALCVGVALMSNDVGARPNGALGIRASARQALGPLIQKLRSLGVDSDTELDAVLDRIKVRAGTRRGEDIIASGRSPMHSTLLLDGVACLYERLQDGTRQIYAFQYSGDFCDLHRHVLPEMNNEVAVAAITDCSIGIIDHKDLEQLIAQYPSLGLALWRASMLEASIFRKRLLNVGRQPALQRVAHLLCEQLARRQAVGLNSATIPLTQMDLADAAGLSIVHINRTFQELRRLNILSKEGRAITVVDRERLAALASFDGNYLNMPQLLSHWQVKIERASTPAERSPAVWCPPVLQQGYAQGRQPKGTIGGGNVSALAGATSAPARLAHRRWL
jgi:CRP-like cAMP-binding protein